MIRPRLTAALALVLLLAGCMSEPDPLKEPLVARLFLEAGMGEPGMRVQLPQSQNVVVINPHPVFTEIDIADADLVRTDGGWCLQLRFTPAAARDLQRLTATRMGRQLLLAFNDQAAGLRRIDRIEAAGTLLIFVEVDDVNLPPLVARLKRTAAAHGAVDR